jgi:hypothetical protein
MQRVAVRTDNKPVAEEEVKRQPMMDLRALLRSRFGG